MGFFRDWDRSLPFSFSAIEKPPPTSQEIGAMPGTNPRVYTSHYQYVATVDTIYIILIHSCHHTQTIYTITITTLNAQSESAGLRLHFIWINKSQTADGSTYLACLPSDVEWLPPILISIYIPIPLGKTSQLSLWFRHIEWLLPILISIYIPILTAKTWQVSLWFRHVRSYRGQLKARLLTEI